LRQHRLDEFELTHARCQVLAAVLRETRQILTDPTQFQASKSLVCPVAICSFGANAVMHVPSACARMLRHTRWSIGLRASISRHTWSCLHTTNWCRPNYPLRRSSCCCLNSSPVRPPRCTLVIFSLSCGLTQKHVQDSLWHVARLSDAQIRQLFQEHDAAFPLRGGRVSCRASRASRRT
jgi:hypothetical protein